MQLEFELNIPEDLKATFEKALNSGMPTVLDIKVDGSQLAPLFRKMPSLITVTGKLFFIKRYSLIDCIYR